MSRRVASRWIGLGLVVAFGLPAACGSNGVVGGECRPGYCAGAQSGNGGLGGTAVGASGDTNLAGENPLGGSENMGGTPTQGGTPAQGGSAGAPEGGMSSVGGSDLPNAGAGGQPVECMPPNDTPQNCGFCGNQCPVDKPYCAPDGEGSFECVPKCIPPLELCQNQCVDPNTFYQSDPDNCGQCGRNCPSGICQAGMCVGARFGNVALLCMDLSAATENSSPTSIFHNAIFMPPKNPVRVLAYTNGATAAAVSRINTVIGWAQMLRNRTATITSATKVGDVTAKLNINDFDVLLVHDLDKAPKGDAAAAASTWESSNVLTSFTKAGGVVVVLDGGDGTGEMNQLINAGHLLDPTGKVTMTGQTDANNVQAWNNAPFDVLGVNVLSPFRGTTNTCTFDLDAKTGSDTIFVVTDDQAGGKPIAIHRVISP